MGISNNKIQRKLPPIQYEPQSNRVDLVTVHRMCVLMRFGLILIMQLALGNVIAGPMFAVVSYPVGCILHMITVG